MGPPSSPSPISLFFHLSSPPPPPPPHARTLSHWHNFLPSLPPGSPHVHCPLSEHISRPTQILLCRLKLSLSSTFHPSIPPSVLPKPDSLFLKPTRAFSISPSHPCITVFLTWKRDRCLCVSLCLKEVTGVPRTFPPRNLAKQLHAKIAPFVHKQPNHSHFCFVFFVFFHSTIMVSKSL